MMTGGSADLCPGNAARPRLLVSVRNSAEAQAALAGGADIIDIKDPARGPLGRAAPEVVAAICAQVAGQRPVTAALGELIEVGWSAPLPAEIALVKLGLGHAPRRWPQLLETAQQHLGKQRLLAVAYADFHRAAAPPMSEVIAWSCSHQTPGLLIDTAVKDGRGLFDFCSEETLVAVLGQCRAAGLFVAVGGALTAADLPRCLRLGAQVIAVRSAACTGGNRQGAVDAEAVAALVRQIDASPAAAGG